MTGFTYDNLDRVFERLRDYLLRDNTFVSQGLNRTHLAKTLRVNEKYLTRAVRKYTRKSLGGYIEELRIAYACRLLVTHPDYTIDAVASESGIGSRSTFFRLFRKHFRCSPDDYRKKYALFPVNEIDFSRI